jgi:hypothetical protein
VPSSGPARTPRRHRGSTSLRRSSVTRYDPPPTLATPHKTLTPIPRPSTGGGRPGGPVPADQGGAPRSRRGRGPPPGEEARHAIMSTYERKQEVLEGRGKTGGLSISQALPDGPGGLGKGDDRLPSLTGRGWPMAWRVAARAGGGRGGGAGADGLGQGRLLLQRGATTTVDSHRRPSPLTSLPARTTRLGAAEPPPRPTQQLTGMWCVALPQ